jgi:hypothetical protein
MEREASALLAVTETSTQTDLQLALQLSLDDSSKELGIAAATEELDEETLRAIVCYLFLSFPTP